MRRERGGKFLDRKSSTLGGGFFSCFPQLFGVFGARVGEGGGLRDRRIAKQGRNSEKVVGSNPECFAPVCRKEGEKRISTYN